MINYFYDCYTILNKVYSDKAFIKQAINSTVIEEKNRSATIKTVYGVIDKDIELSYYLSFLCDKSPKLAIRTILKIAMYCIKHLGKKEYAVVQNAVELTKKLGKGGASAFVNAILRKFIKEQIPMPKDSIKRLSVKYSYPEFALKKLIDKYGEDRTKRIVSYQDDSNYLFFPEIDGEKYLKECGVDYKPTCFDRLFSVNGFVRNADYDKGIYTYQSLGSFAICNEVNPCDKILDCCAAPGGKSINLSYKCKQVISWDIHAHRVELIDDYKNRMNRENVFAFVKDAKILDSSLIESFDAVLCDAPCSGLGVTYSNPDIKLNRLDEDVKSLNKEQLSILTTVSNYVKVGGYLYYSTCSILPQENIEIIEKFLNQNTNFEIESIDSPLSHENEKGANAFLPDVSYGQGFYLAKLKRIK
ncbi:MAG: hypothetical protein IKB98_04735 [Clostridia bacterium]|nr:hypothetical protein [Clostridia bacterium]